MGKFYYRPIMKNRLSKLQSQINKKIILSRKIFIFFIIKLIYNCNINFFINIDGRNNKNYNYGKLKIVSISKYKYLYLFENTFSKACHHFHMDM